jgi:hypothetical protein
VAADGCFFGVDLAKRVPNRVIRFVSVDCDTVIGLKV